MHWMQHDSQLYRQHIQWSILYHRVRHMKMSQPCYLRHLEQHRELGMVHGGHKWLLLMHFVNGIGIFRRKILPQRLCFQGQLPESVQLVRGTSNHNILLFFFFRMNFKQISTLERELLPATKAGAAAYL